MQFTDKTVLVSGGSRGIGLAIVKKLAQNGANIVIAAKTVSPHTIVFWYSLGMDGLVKAS